MAEKRRSPAQKETGKGSGEATTKSFAASRTFLPFGLGLILLFAGCFWWGNQSSDPSSQEILATPSLTQNSRSPESNAALTRVASSLAEAHVDDPTATPSPVEVEEQVPMPTVTPTVVPSPVATRTIELSGDATLRLQLNSDSFESNGQPVTIAVEPHAYVLGGDALSKGDKWCMQVGPTGLVFDLVYTLHPVTEKLHVGGQMQLYDGFCGEWGKLGNLLSTVPMDLTIPAGSSAQIAPTLQVQASFLGLPNLLDISTGVFLNLNIRNPSAK